MRVYSITCVKKKTISQQQSSINQAHLWENPFFPIQKRNCYEFTMGSFTQHMMKTARNLATNRIKFYFYIVMLLEMNIFLVTLTYLILCNNKIGNYNITLKKILKYQQQHFAVDDQRFSSNLGSNC